MPPNPRPESTVPNDDLTTRRQALIQDLYIWGPSLVQEVRSKYPIELLHELEQNKVLARRKFIGFEVYLLSGAGLRPYGYSLRYNYVPSKSVVLGAIIVRALARQYREKGYEVEFHEGYSKRGRDNILLVRKDGLLTVVLGRASITLKSARIIVSTLLENLGQIDSVHAVVIQGDYDNAILNANKVSGVPFDFIQHPMTYFTREEFTSSKS